MADDLVHMKQKPPENSAVMADLDSNQEQYPYGLRLDLGEDELKKLRLEMPAVGEMVHIMAMCKVIRCHASASEDHTHSSCELQITHMKAEVEDTEGDEEVDTRTPAQKIYGKK